MLDIPPRHHTPRRREEGVDALLRLQGIMGLKELGEMIKSTSLCGLGQTAPNPVLSTLKWFRDEYEAHIFERRCPAGACKKLVGAPCMNTCPVGTEVWRYRGSRFPAANTPMRTASSPGEPLPVHLCPRLPSSVRKDCAAPARQAAKPIAVRSLKRFVVGTGPPRTAITPEVQRLPLPTRPASPSSGAGPSGLTALLHCLGDGLQSHGLEKEAKAGRHARGGHSRIRLPRRAITQKELTSCSTRTLTCS